jgi:hypothetical protein
MCSYLFCMPPKQYSTIHFIESSPRITSAQVQHTLTTIVWYSLNVRVSNEHLRCMRTNDNEKQITRHARVQSVVQKVC